MGNNNTSKDSHNSTGSPSDFFSTPPTTPTEAQLAAMAFSSSAFNKKVEQKGTAAGGTTPSTILPTTDWTRRLSASTEWAVISQDAIASPERSGSDAAVSRGTAAGNRSRGSPAEHDSGLGPQTGAEMMTGEETTLVLLSLMEHYRASLGLSPGQDAATGAVELLRRFLVERDDLLVERDGLGEEVRCLKDKLKVEREEWHQFQCDLQVAVAVADRMRAEAEEALAECQRSHRALEEQLAQTLGTQQDTDRELDGLRAQHRDTDRELDGLRAQHRDVCRQLALERGQLQALRAAAHMQTAAAGSDKDAERKDSRAEGQTMEDEWREGGSRGVPKGEDPEDETAVAHTGGEAKCNGNHNEVKEKETAQEAHSKAVGQDANVADKGEEMQLRGKGVAETYLRSLAVLGRKAEDGGSLRDRRKIVMLSERSRSLSRLSLPPNLISQNGTSQCSTLPLCKKEEPTKDGSDHIFQRQESLASFYSKKQEQDPNLDYNKPQDGFSVLLRRHGGSRRNSLLRWCQTRTQGYKNIDITNFSSSWEDGLAFCAVYHTYLPSHIPYGSLCPADKEGNLGLAFQTGESVGITAMLTVEEMLKAGGPDWQRVLGYVDSIFRHFEM